MEVPLAVSAICGGGDGESTCLVVFLASGREESESRRDQQDRCRDYLRPMQDVAVMLFGVRCR